MMVLNPRPLDVQESRAITRKRIFAPADEPLAVLAAEKFTGKVTLTMNQGGVQAVVAEDSAPIRT